MNPKLSESDLLVALTKIIDWSFGANYSESVDAARDILTSGLVVPASAVNDLANEWDAFPNEAVPPYKPLDAHRCAAELRARLRREIPPNENSEQAKQISRCISESILGQRCELQEFHGSVHEVAEAVSPYMGRYEWMD